MLSFVHFSLLVSRPVCLLSFIFQSVYRPVCLLSFIFSLSIGLLVFFYFISVCLSIGLFVFFHSFSICLPIGLFSFIHFSLSVYQPVFFHSFSVCLWALIIFQTACLYMVLFVLKKNVFIHFLSVFALWILVLSCVFYSLFLSVVDIFSFLSFHVFSCLSICVCLFAGNTCSNT